MPAGTTFSTLITDLQSYLERGNSVVDPTVYAQLPRLVNLAERAIARRLKISGMTIIILGSLAAKVPVYSKPNGWRRTISMNFGTGAPSPIPFTADSNIPADSSITVDATSLGTSEPVQNNRTPLFTRTYEYCRYYWPDDTQTSQPKFYADYDYQHWLITPTPDINYPWEIAYYGLPALLDNTNQTNFWTNFAPETLLYRTLLDCAPYLKNDERLPTWKALYEEAVTNLENEDLSRAVDRASVRKED